MGLPFMHGLQSTLFAARLGRRLGIDRETSVHAYYACMLFHAGCTTDAEIAAEIFGGPMTEHSLPVMFASQPAMLAGLYAPCRRPAARCHAARSRLRDALRARPARLAHTSSPRARWRRCWRTVSGCRLDCRACSRT